MIERIAVLVGLILIPAVVTTDVGAEPKVQFIAPSRGSAVPASNSFRIVGRIRNPDGVKRIQVRVGRKVFVAKGIKKWRVTVESPSYNGPFTVIATAKNRRGRPIAERALRLRSVDIFND